MLFPLWISEWSTGFRDSKVIYLVLISDDNMLTLLQYDKHSTFFFVKVSSMFYLFTQQAEKGEKDQSMEIHGSVKKPGCIWGMASNNA